MRLKYFMSFIFVIICFNNIFSQAEKIRAVVFDLEGKSGLSKEETMALSDTFRVELEKTGLFELVSRDQLDKIMNEYNFQMSTFTSETSEEERIRIGKVLNVKIAVLGSMNVVFGKFSINVFVLDMETGKILWSETTRSDMGEAAFDKIKEVAMTLGGKIKQTRIEKDKVVIEECLNNIELENMKSKLDNFKIRYGDTEEYKKLSGQFKKLVEITNLISAGKYQEAKKAIPLYKQSYGESIKLLELEDTINMMISESSKVKGGGISGLNITGYILAVIGLGGIGGGYYFDYAANGAYNLAVTYYNEYNNATSDFDIKWNDFVTYREKTKELVLYRNISYIAGGVTTAVGIVLALIPSGSTQSQAAFYILPNNILITYKF